MTNEWKKIALDGGVRSPEAHWLSDVPVERGPCPCSIRLSREAAAFLVDRYGDRFGLSGLVPAGLYAAGGPDPLLARLVPRVRFGQETFSALIDFLNRQDGPDAIHVSVLVDEEEIASLSELSIPEHCRVTEVGLGLPLEAYGSGAVVHPDNNPAYDAPTELDGSEVVIAIIDDGIGFVNTRFRLDLTQTRIEYFWDMRVPPEVQDNSDAPVGRVLRKSKIDALLREHPYDEERIYRKVGLIDTRTERRQQSRFQATHGTHILDIAAGYDFTDPRQREIAAKRPIIAVQLPSEVIAERSDAFTAQWLKFALDKIREQAIELAIRTARSTNRELRYFPLVVNFSFGTFAGPHDGESTIERTIQAFIDNYRALPGGPLCEVVIPVGNSYQSRAIARLVASNHGLVAASGRDGTHEHHRVAYLPWRVQPDDKTASFVQIWTPEAAEGSGQRVAVSLTPPSGGPQEACWTELGSASEWVSDGRVLARLYHQTVPRKNGMNRECVVIAIRGTGSDIQGEPRCPPGLWTIGIKNLGLRENDCVDVRIRRDDSLRGQRSTGRQSYFDHPDYVVRDPITGRIQNHSAGETGPVTRRDTFNSYATGLRPVVVGGYRQSDGTPASYSGAGPVGSEFEKPGPTLAAVSDESPAVPGVLAAGTYSGSTLRQNGTSVAAPAVVRALADCFASGCNRQTFVTSIARIDAAGLPGTQQAYAPVDPSRQGVGRLPTAPVPRHRRQMAD